MAEKRHFPIEKIRNIGIIAHIDAAKALKPSGFSTSATGKLPFSRPLSRVDMDDRR